MKISKSKFRRRDRLRIALLLATMTALTATNAGCESGSAADRESRKPTKLNSDHPVVQPHGSGEVKIEIRNLNSKAELFRVEGNQVIPVEVLPPAAVVAKSVQSGFYMLRPNDSSMSYPVPALNPFLKNDATSTQIEIELTTEPKPKPGWCWIPPGPAIVGDTLGVGREDERPAQIVDLPEFRLAQHEVTNDQYAQFLTEVPKTDDGIPEGWIDLLSRKCRIQESENGTFQSDAGDLPVVMVSLAGANAYCQWRTNTTKITHRLPTEAEWEKAARGPESFVYSYGNIYKQSLANQESGKLKPVGSYEPNSFGLYDMTGNVFEWMSNVADPSSSATTLNHSLRGGSFVLDGMYLRNSFRMRQSPTVMTDDIGFRVLQECPGQMNLWQNGNPTRL